jgi:hypothetical protein
MNIIRETLAREIHKQSARFVFPSETAASAWAGKIYGLTGLRSVALDRFIAWDRFKERVLRAELQNKQPVSGVIRKLFAGFLVGKNAEAARRLSPPAGAAALPGFEGLPFRSLIPPAFAGEGHIFADEIARLLPSLGLLRARQETAGASPDDEDRDFAALERIYADFLRQKDLFEPSWEKPPLGDRAHEYYIFFPEAMEDFIEYEALLRGEPTIHLITLEAGDGKDGRGNFRHYDSVRTEIRGTVLDIHRLHETQGIPYGEMAVSVPALEELDAYLLREFGLYDIPVRRRSGRPLADYGTGRVFSLINDCGVNSFSFSSLKSLLLNEQLPWRYPNLNKELIEFGVLNNCVSGYREKGRPVDVWEAAFKINPREEKLRNYYGELKPSIMSMTAARTFTELRNRYFAFRGQVWGGVFSEEGNAVLARCIEELSALIQLEEEYPDLIPASPFSFYLSLLREKQYVPVQREGGVNVFPYRVAAASPFACHFILNASQNAATVLYRPLKFLRQDKRKRLGVADTDASAAFFRLYLGQDSGGPSFVRISSSDRTFAGWAIPHSFFAGDPGAADTSPGDQDPRDQDPRDQDPWELDPFTTELDWWAGESAGGFPAGLFPVQKEGFERWKIPLCGEAPGKHRILSQAFDRRESAARLLRERIAQVQYLPEDPGCIKVSATDLNGFFYCPAFWLYRKILRLAEYAPEAKLLDDVSLGLLYHEILKNLFTRIREEDIRFLPEHLELYRRWAADYTLEAAHRYPAFRGPLAVPLLVSQSKAITQKLFGLLRAEAKYFPGYTVSALESALEIRRGDLLLNGRIDRVSISPEGEPVIIDYKTGAAPSKKDSTETEDTPLADFQMPMYVRLYEEGAKQKICGAFFFSINQRDINAVIGSPGGKKGHSREEYQASLDALDRYAAEFSRAVTSLDFSSPGIVFENCAGCDYKNLCRTTFSLNNNSQAEAPHVP